MNDWIRFDKDDDVAQPKGGEWHRAARSVDVDETDRENELVDRYAFVLTHCGLYVRTRERPGKLPGAGARMCETCLGQQQLEVNLRASESVAP